MKKQIILQEKNFSRLKELIKKNRENEIVFSSEDDNLNRKVLEKLKVDILLIPLEERRDYTKQRDSGFNEFMAKIAKKNKIKIGIDFDELVNSKFQERILSRIKQNIILCNKNKVQMKFVFKTKKRNIYNLKSLGLVLGMPTWMIKKLD